MRDRELASLQNLLLLSYRTYSNHLCPAHYKAQAGNNAHFPDQTAANLYVQVKPKNTVEQRNMWNRLLLGFIVKLETGKKIPAFVIRLYIFCTA